MIIANLQQVTTTDHKSELKDIIVIKVEVDVLKIDKIKIRQCKKTSILTGLFLADNGSSKPKGRQILNII